MDAGVARAARSAAIVRGRSTPFCPGQRAVEVARDRGDVAGKVVRERYPSRLDDVRGDVGDFLLAELSP